MERFLNFLYFLCVTNFLIPVVTGTKPLPGTNHGEFFSHFCCKWGIEPEKTAMDIYKDLLSVL
jgi:hypothetical protein